MRLSNDFVAGFLIGLGVGALTGGTIFMWLSIGLFKQ